MTAKERRTVVKALVWRLQVHEAAADKAIDNAIVGYGLEHLRERKPK